MKIGKQQFGKDDFLAYSEIMRGLPISDNQELFDKEINEALDQLSRIYDIIGNTSNQAQNPNRKNLSNSSSINNAAKLK